MKCPNCTQELKEISVDIEDAKTPVIRYNKKFEFKIR